MKDNVKLVLAFVSGVAVSAVTLGSYFKDKYEREVNAEIQKTRDFYKTLYDIDHAPVPVVKKKEPIKTEKKPEENIRQNKSAPIMEKAVEIAKENNYFDYSNLNNDETEGIVEYIPPEEYGMGTYDVIELHYDSEHHKVTDDKGFPVENWADRLGSRFVSHFGEYEDDCTYIRNHEMRTDYQVIMDDFDIDIYDPEPKDTED